MPRIRLRVVCTLCETMVTLAPTSAMKPQRVSLGVPSGIDLVRSDADIQQHFGCRGLFGCAFGAALSFRRRMVRQFDSYAEFGIVVRTGTRNLAIGRSRQAAR